MSSSQQQSRTSGAILTPQEYASQTGLESLLNKCVNDCYLTQSSCPAATLSSLLQATYSVDLISDVTVSECLDGDSGGTSAEVRVSLACGVEASTVVSHSNATLPFHPSTAVNRPIALVPAEVLAMEGPGSLRHALQPPTANGAGNPTAATPSAGGKSGKQGGGSGAEAARLLNDQQGGAVVGDFAAAGSASALVHASKFQLTGPLQYFSESVRPKLVATLRAAQQQALDDAVKMPDTTYASLLGQVAGSISLCCAKAAAKSLGKPLYSHIGQMYQALDGGGDRRVGSTSKGMQAGGGGVGGVRHGSYAIPNIAISIFTNTDPRSPAKVRAVREVLLMINLQNNAPSSCTPQLDAMLVAEAAAARSQNHPHRAAAGGGHPGTFSCPLANGASDGASILKAIFPPAGSTPIADGTTTTSKAGSGKAHHVGLPAEVPSTSTFRSAAPTLAPLLTSEFGDFYDPQLSRNGLLHFRTVSAANAIVHVAMAKLATVAGAALGVSPSVAEAALMPTATNGGTKAPFFDSIAAAVQCVEEAIKEVTGNPNYFDMPVAPTDSSAAHSAHATDAPALTQPTAGNKKGNAQVVAGGGAGGGQDGAIGGRGRSSGYGIGGGTLSDVAAAIALKASFSPPPLFTVGLVVDGTMCARQPFYPSANHDATTVAQTKYCVVQGEPDVSGKQLADTLAHLACVEKPNVLTYLEDTHSFNDVDGMQRLMGKVFGARMVQRLAADGTPIAAAGHDDTGVTTPVTNNALNTSNHDDGSGGNPQQLTALPLSINQHLLVAGNHLYGSSLRAVEKGVGSCLTNHTVLRLNDVGSISSLLDTAFAVRTVAAASQPAVFGDGQWGSSSSVGLVGETCEGDGAALAHIAVGIHARTLRVGGLLRREHAATLNELVRISEQLKKSGTISTSASIFDSRLLVLPEVPIEAPKEDVVEKPGKKGRK